MMRSLMTGLAIQNTKNTPSLESPQNHQLPRRSGKHRPRDDGSRSDTDAEYFSRSAKGARSSGSCISCTCLHGDVSISVRVDAGYPMYSTLHKCSPRPPLVSVIRHRRSVSLSGSHQKTVADPFSPSDALTIETRRSDPQSSILDCTHQLNRRDKAAGAPTLARHRLLLSHS